MEHFTPQERCYGNQLSFVANLKIDILPPSFLSAGVPQKFEYRYTNLRINNGDDLATSCVNLVKVGPVTPEITPL